MRRMPASELDTEAFMSAKILILFPWLIVAPTPLCAQNRPPIIDMHMHAPVIMPRTPAGQPLPRPCVPEPPCQPAPAAAKGDADLLRLALEAMDRHNVVLGFLSDAVPNVDTWVQAAPTRFLPSPMIGDPTRIEIAALRKAYAAGKLRGMGELTNQYYGIAGNDPIMDPMFALATEFDLPVLIHSEGVAGPSAKFRIAQGHPELLQDVLIKHPRLRLWLENAGFPFLEETIALLYRYPQVYADLSTVTWIIPRETFHRYMRGLVDAGLTKRLMFGSDQMTWPETIGLAIEAIESADFLTPEQRRDIFYNNAARFLRLSDQEIARHHGR